MLFRLERSDSLPQRVGVKVFWRPWGPREFFGEMALVDAAPRSATATAMQDNTKLVVLDQTKFLYLVGQHPPFALVIMRVLCERIRTSNPLYSRLLGKRNNEAIPADPDEPEPN